MSLQITEKQGTYYLKGKINASTFKAFETYFKYNLQIENKIIVNIDNVTEIDKAGLDTMRDLTKTAMLNLKTFSIIGYGCKDIYDDFNATIAA